MQQVVWPRMPFKAKEMLLLLFEKSSEWGKEGQISLYMGKKKNPKDNP